MAAERYRHIAEGGGGPKISKPIGRDAAADDLMGARKVRGKRAPFWRGASASPAIRGRESGAPRPGLRTSPSQASLDPHIEALFSCRDDLSTLFKRCGLFAFLFCSDLRVLLQKLD
jgi:hypothetical protein